MLFGILGLIFGLRREPLRVALMWAGGAFIAGGVFILLATGQRYGGPDWTLIADRAVGSAFWLMVAYGAGRGGRALWARARGTDV